MNPYSSPESSTTARASRSSSFFPFLLLALSLIITLLWSLSNAVQSRNNGQRLSEQQARPLEQSRKVQGELRTIARELVELARTDDEAKALVTKYKISFTNPVPAQAPAASPSPSP